MARSWDARVRGASFKRKASGGDNVEVGADEGADLDALELPTAGLAPVTSGEAAEHRAKPSTPDPLRAVNAGMALAIEALDAPVVVVARHSGQVLWMSAQWEARFGRQTQLARYFPSSTDLGEAPLPPPDQAWQRTRSIQFANGAEDVVELLMAGGIDDDVEIVSIVASFNGSQSLVTDPAEAISFIDGALSEGAAGSVAVLYIDLDRFKVVHDLLGNVDARRLLEVVARRLASAVRGTDLLFRLPSDEFVVIACELDYPQVAEELAERLRVAVATVTDTGRDMALTASVGIAIADVDSTGDKLLSAAETAVCVAKGRGRNRVALHDEEVRTRSQRLLVVERQLRMAIEQRDVRFAYQPVVHLPTGDVIGAEALLRLGGELGLSTVEVVAAAEHSGLMGTLGTLVLEGVDEQLGDRLRDPNTEQTLMVNLSATQLADDGLAETLHGIAADSTIPDGRLAVEVPEVVIRTHRKEYLDLVNALQPQIKFGVDGFGASHDSQDVLADLPVDYAKIHRSLTLGLGQDAESRRRLGGIIEELEARRVSVIALGVERTDQVAILQELGCTTAQGFLYAGAVNADDLTNLMERGFVNDIAGR